MSLVSRWFGLFALSGVALFLIWFGWLYANVDNVLFFHAAAVDPSAIEPMKPLYFALMRLVGGASAGLGLLGLFTVWTAVRQGSVTAAAAVLVTFCVSFVAAAYTAEKLAADTGAPTTWHIMGILIAVTLVGFATTWASKR